MEWQNNLSKFRNHFLEHRKASSAKFVKFYDPAVADKILGSTWKLMADLFPVLIASHFSPGFSIERIPDDERDLLHVLSGSPQIVSQQNEMYVSQSPWL
jgi:hypothetical protein